jgi:hypothetical protein
MNVLDQVLYLCFSQKGEEGFVFPSDLNDEDYNPGIFIVIGDYNYKLEEVYSFIAFDGDTKITTDLKRFNSTTFGVNTKHGLFLFRAKRISKQFNNFFGAYNLFSKGKSMFELIPMQSDRLESVCRSNNFYFLGATDEDME